MMTTRHIAPVRRPWLRIGLVLLGAVSLLVAGCSDDGESTNGTTDAPADSETSSIQIDGAWARTSPMNAANGAAYMDITNSGDGDDALVGVSLSSDIADRAELHETRAVNTGDSMSSDDSAEDMMGDNNGSGDMMDGDDSAPMMEMVEVDSIPLPAGETVSLEPGGLHIMIMELLNGLEDGSEIELTLSFEVADDMVVTATVGDGTM